MPENSTHDDPLIQKWEKQNIQTALKYRGVPQEFHDVMMPRRDNNDDEQSAAGRRELSADIVHAQQTLAILDASINTLQELPLYPLLVDTRNFFTGDGMNRKDVQDIVARLAAEGTVTAPEYNSHTQQYDSGSPLSFIGFKLRTPATVYSNRSGVVNHLYISENGFRILDSHFYQM